MKTSKENEETKNSTHGIRALIEGKRFESYVAMAFTQELCVDKYNQGIKYSYVDEIVNIEDILDSQNIKGDEKNQIIKKLYLKLQEELNNISFKFQCSEESSSQFSSFSGRTDNKSKDKKLNNISNDIKKTTNKIDNEMVNANIKNTNNEKDSEKLNNKNIQNNKDIDDINNKNLKSINSINNEESSQNLNNKNNEINQDINNIDNKNLPNIKFINNETSQNINTKNNQDIKINNKISQNDNNIDNQNVNNTNNENIQNVNNETNQNIYNINEKNLYNKNINENVNNLNNETNQDINNINSDFKQGKKIGTKKSVYNENEKQSDKKKEKKEKKEKKKNSIINKLINERQNIEDNEKENEDKKDEVKKKMKKKIDIKGKIENMITKKIKEKNEKKLVNILYKKKNKKCCIVYNKNKITELPDKFHLFIEVGLDVYKNEFRSKSRQIYKYISILNIENLIDNKSIKSIYHKNFQERYGLNFNTKQNIADTNVYMLISNSSYEEFKKRFLDNKEFKKEKDFDIFNGILQKDSKDFLFCGYVYFQKLFNENINDKIEHEQNKKMIEDLNKKMNHLNHYIMIFSFIIIVLIILIIVLIIIILIK